MSAPAFASCSYSVFFSFAVRDNEVPWPNWIGDFHSELRKALPDRINGVPVPPIYFSEINGPLRGELDRELQIAVGESFAMVIFVADYYLNSTWCLNELQYFKSIFGSEGFRERLFIVAMSKPAIDELKLRTQWRAICGEMDLVHLPFHRRAKDVANRPLAMFVADQDRPGRMIFPATDFWDLFLDFREALETQMSKAVLREAPAVGYPAALPAGRANADDLVRVYIEADRRQDRYWQSLQRQVVAKWDEVAAGDDVEPPLHLRPEPLEVANLARDSVLQLANGVILLWAKKSAASVRDQIIAIEPCLPSDRNAPGIVAYLSSGPDDKPPAESIQNWPVIRFRVRETDGSTTVLAADAPKLTGFMQDVLLHKRGG